MTTNSYLEYYLTLLAWIISNGVWSTLVESGVFAIAFVAIVLDEWVRARGEGADEGNKGLLALARIENRVWVAYVVILFTCMPLIPIDLQQMEFNDTASTQCGVSVPKPSSTGWSKTFQSIGNQSASVPLWWYVAHSLSKGVTAASVAAIPCSPDIRRIAMDIDASRISDKVLLQEVADFTHDCYGGARYRMSNNRPVLTKEEDYDTSWIGSEYFLTQPGYYDTLRSMVPRKNWPYDETRDATLAKVAHGGGYPTCVQWWSDSGVGLRERLLAHVDPTILTRLQGWLTSRSAKEIEEATLRQLVSPQHQARVMNPGEIFQEYGASSRSESGGNALTNVSTSLGFAMASPKFYTSMNALKTALPMVQAFLLMAIVICLPLIITISTYSMKAVMTATFGLFALHFLTFWWELARWIDSSMLDALYGEVATGEKFLLSIPVLATVADGTITSDTMSFVMATTFILLPMVFFSTMGWAGYAVGSAVGSMLEKGSNSAAQAGGEFANQAVQQTSGAAMQGGIRAGVNKFKTTK